MSEIIDKILTFSWDAFPYFMIMVTIVLSVKSLLWIESLFGAGNPITWLLVFPVMIGTVFAICFFQVMHNVFRGKYHD